MSAWLPLSAFGEIAALLGLAAALGALGLLLRQPLIVSFIAVGIVAGPSALDIVHSSEPIELLAELGVAVLLFLVGIKLDVKLIRTLGPVSLATGLGQVLFTASIGFVLCRALGLDAVASFYVAVALTFSSTIIIVKLLSDKKEIDSLHGQVALGFLIVQDLVVVVAMIALSAVGIGARVESATADILAVVGAGTAMLLGVLAFVRYAATPLTERLARTPELLICFAIALAATLAAAGDALGFGKELGGLLAGVAVASTPYRDAIAARLSPLRDFLLLFFFVALGARLDLGNLGQSGIAAITLSAFVLIGNPLIVVVIMAGLGYRRRTGFLAGLTVAQISEFSLVFMAMGVTVGHVGEDALGLVTLVGLITIAGSTYMITYSHQLYQLCEPLVGSFAAAGWREPGEQPHDGDQRYDFVVFGLGRYGDAIGRRLALAGGRVLGVDFNPDAVRRWQAHGFDAIYGDVTDPELIASLPRSCRWAILTIREPNSGVHQASTHRVLVRTLRDHGFDGRVAVAAAHDRDLGPFAGAEADIVLDPFQDAADRAVEILLSEAPPTRLPSDREEGQREIDD